MRRGARLRTAGAAGSRSWPTPGGRRRRGRSPGRPGARPPRGPPRARLQRRVRSGRSSDAHRDDEHELTTGRDGSVGRSRRQVAQGAADDRLVALGEFPADRPATGRPADRERDRGAWPRPGPAPRTGSAPRGSAAMAASRSFRSRPERGRNPSNVQRGPATPDPATAASTAEAPGIGTTVPPSPAQAATRSAPGSLTIGVPASVMSATSSPARRRSSSSPGAPARCGRG